MKITTILTTHRTGSWWLGNALDSSHNCFLGEVLNPNDMSIKKIGIGHKHIKKAFTKLDTKIINKYLKEKNYTTKIIGTLNITNQEFYRDWMKKVKDIINISENIIINYRSNLIEQYISLLKAQKIKRWSGIDTSDIKIQWSMKEFIEYKKIFLKHYNWYLKETEGKNRTILCYENIHKRNDTIDYLNNHFSSLSLSIEKNKKNIFKKQELNNPIYSIENFLEFEKDIEKLNTTKESYIIDEKTFFNQNDIS
jgi:LPS sulfotransferase NodH